MRKIQKVSLSLFMVSLIMAMIGLLVMFSDPDNELRWNIAALVVILAIFFASISVLLALVYLVTKNNVRRLDNSYMLHSEIEYVIDNKQIRFVKKNIVVNVLNIKSIKMEVNQQVVYSSGMTEAIVGGVLFGGSGAIAGSILGSKPKLTSKAIIYIETDLIQYAGLTIATTPQKGFEICKVIEALMK
jgi:hypothetical protein